VIGRDCSRTTGRNPLVQWSGYWFGSLRGAGSRIRMGLDMGETMFPVQIRTPGRLPGPVPNSSNAPWNGRPEDLDCSSVLEQCPTRWRITCCCRGKALIRSGIKFPMGPYNISCHRLGEPQIDFHPITKCKLSKGNDTNACGSCIEGSVSGN
jgi:hypothetical protein